MNAFTITQYGTPEVFHAHKLSTPLIGPKEVLIKVIASGLNPMDFKVRRGDMKKVVPIKFPKILGADIAGIVSGVGSEVTDLQPNDEVYAMLPTPQWGGYGEYVTVKAKYLAKKPTNLSFEEAASFPVAGLTAWQALRKKAKIYHNSRVLINSASGGVGTFAVQIAKAARADITAVCSAKNFNLVKDLGANEVIDYNSQDFTQLPYQYDVIFDVIGNRSFSECKSILTHNGVYITTTPALPEVVSSVLTKVGSKKSKIITVKPRKEDLYQLAQYAEAGMIKPVIEKVYNASERELVEAHQRMESGHTVGKLVMAMNFPDADKAD
uniref:NAD(P)-dependent alcohol dehydrogenase n=1 Tax=Roseihalotalea indica TaxID=2867963 RepID=A0AA49GIL1_9BACT|nr:NAD(P)-dependent alcohol dehydrogenase [Tunicatimonas sp. TK19036]